MSTTRQGEARLSLSERAACGKAARGKVPRSRHAVAHASNVGLFASPERRLVFDINDLDETFLVCAPAD